MFKIGIAGLSRGATFLSFNLIPEFKVTALCDIDRDRVEACGEQYNIPKVFIKYEDMIESSDLDIVVIATPVMLHVQQSVQALEAGLDVLSEVTAATTFDECRTLVNAVEKSGRKYMMAENCCYLKENILLKELIAVDKFGELYFGEGEMIYENKRSKYNPDGSLNWKGRYFYGRNGNVYPTHSLGPLYQMFNERIISVSCLGSGFHKISGIKLEDTIITLCKTESGKLLKLRLDIISDRPRNHNYYALQGTKGCYEAPRGLGDTHKVWFLGECEEDKWKPLNEYEERYLPEKWKNRLKEARENKIWNIHDFFMMRDFADSIIYNRRPPIDVYDALNMTAPGISSEISIERNGKPVEVPEFKR